MTGIGGLPIRRTLHPELPDDFRPLASLEGKIVSANGYMGADVMVDALRQGADVVLTGRVGDCSLFLAPMIYEYLRARYLKEPHGHASEGIVTIQLERRPPWVDLAEYEEDDRLSGDDEEDDE